jgi:hypothetical protein
MVTVTGVSFEETSGTGVLRSALRFDQQFLGVLFHNIGLRGGNPMEARQLTLSRSLVVSTPSIWIASLICFYLLEFRDGILLRTIGPAPTYLLVGMAYLLIAACPLSTLISRKRRLSFGVVFGGFFVAAIGLMVLVLKLVPGVAGGFAAGAAAIWCLGSGISRFLDRGSNFLVIGFLLACWTFPGDYAGYSARHALGGLEGAAVYASIYGLFFGSGLGALLWHVQKNERP